MLSSNDAVNLFVQSLIGTYHVKLYESLYDGSNGLPAFAISYLRMVADDGSREVFIRTRSDFLSTITLVEYDWSLNTTERTEFTTFRAVGFYPVNREIDRLQDVLIHSGCVSRTACYVPTCSNIGSGSGVGASCSGAFVSDVRFDTFDLYSEFCLGCSVKFAASFNGLLSLTVKDSTELRRFTVGAHFSVPSMNRLEVVRNTDLQLFDMKDGVWAQLTYLKYEGNLSLFFFNSQSVSLFFCSFCFFVEINVSFSYCSFGFLIEIILDNGRDGAMMPFEKISKKMEMLYLARPDGTKDAGFEQALLLDQHKGLQLLHLRRLLAKNIYIGESKLQSLKIQYDAYLSEIVMIHPRESLFFCFVLFFLLCLFAFREF